MIVFIEKLFKNEDQEVWVPIYVSFSIDSDTEVFFMPSDELRIQKFTVDSIEELNQIKEDWKKSVMIKQDGEE